MASLTKLIRFIGDDLKENITKNSHYVLNQDSVATYPYLTFDVSTEYYENHTDVGTIDIDIFDSAKSYGKIIAIEDLLKSRYRLTNGSQGDGFIVRIDFERSMNIPTADPLIKRRTVQLNIKIDWSEV